MYELPILPLIFDTTPGLGATKLRATWQYTFFHIRGRFGTPAAVVTFSPFWAGKFRRHAKIAYAIIAHHCHGVSPGKANPQNKTTKRRDPDAKNGRGTKFRTGDETLGGKRNLATYGMRHGDRKTWVAREGLTASEGASPTYGLRFGSPCPSRGRSHSVGTGAWQQEQGVLLHAKNRAYPKCTNCPFCP